MASKKKSTKTQFNLQEIPSFADVVPQKRRSLFRRVFDSFSIFKKQDSLLGKLTLIDVVFGLIAGLMLPWVLIVVKGSGPIGYSIVATFFVGSVLSSNLSFKIARKTISQEELERSLGFYRHLNSLLVMLGLLGTVVGSADSLLSIDPTAAADASRIPQVLRGVLDGMGVALYTTVLGSITNIWLGLKLSLIERSK